MKNRFFLKSVAVENFKAVKSCSIELTPLTVFIGNNGSGKSSVIEALESYREILAHGLDAAFERWHGFKYVLNKRASGRRRSGFFAETAPLSLHCKGVWGRGAFNVKMVAGLDAGGNTSRIQRELLKLPSGRLYRRTSDGKCEAFEGSTMERLRRIEPGESAAPQDWVQLTQHWQFLALEPSPMGEPSPPTLTGGWPILRRDGSNLGQYLWSLRDASVEAFEGLLESLRVVLPYVRDLQPVLIEAIERSVHVEITEASFKLPGWLLSTGTLRLLAILACLRHPQAPPLLVIEEIENGLDPRALQLVVAEVQEAIEARVTQIVVTTHSPYLLDLLHLSHIVVVERDDNEPKFYRPADEKELQRWAKDFSPGQLYTMGRLTGSDEK